ncbi:MFS general substrate transporter [Trichoderma chlorosporum]
MAIASYSGDGTPDNPFIVQWLEDDVENPITFPYWYKWFITILAGLMTFCVTLSSSAYTGAAQQIIGQFRCSEELFLAGLSLMVLGFAVGPVVFAPLSEVVGRRIVLLACMIFYVLWTAVCASAQNIQSLLVFRFFCGTMGAATFVIPAGQVADLFESEQRGVAAAVFSAAPFLGPTLGPAIGGFLGAGAGWRWLMGMLALFGASLSIFGLLFIPETFAPVLLRQRAKLLSKATGKLYVTKMDLEKPVIFRDIVRKSLMLPFILLFQEPIVLFISTYMAVVYGILYLCFAAFPIIFQQGHGWNAGQGGLSFLGMMVGVLTGVAIVVLDNKRYVRINKQHGGMAPAEARLPFAIVGGILAVVGIAWLAATASPSVHWIVPILAGFPYGVGFMMIFLCCTNYLIDSYVIYAASVMAANSILRSVFGAVFPLFTTYMYRNLGVHWATAVPGFIALGCVPFPILFFKYGAMIRRKCKYSGEAARFLDVIRSAQKRSTENNTEKKDDDSAEELNGQSKQIEA